jgi:DNA-binding NarL/FixJ family response regulator
LNKPSVLLADDHPGVTEILALRLKPAFKIVGIVRNGQELVDAVTNLNPDLIITDIFLPILNGFEAVRRLRESGCSSKVIFLTASADPHLANTCLSAGATGFVVKQRISLDLLPAIQAALAGKVFVSPDVRNRDGA